MRLVVLQSQSYFKLYNFMHFRFVNPSIKLCLQTKQDPKMDLLENLQTQSHHVAVRKPLRWGVSPCDAPDGRSFTHSSESQCVQPSHKQRVHIHHLGHQSEGIKNEAINKITTISFCEKAQIFSCLCVIISLSGLALSLGTQAVKSLPMPHSLSAHSQCYATANYFHSAPTKPWQGRERGTEREDKVKETERMADGQAGGRAGRKEKRREKRETLRETKGR